MSGSHVTGENSLGSGLHEWMTVEATSLDRCGLERSADIGSNGVPVYDTRSRILMYLVLCSTGLELKKFRPYLPFFHVLVVFALDAPVAREVMILYLSALDYQTAQPTECQNLPHLSTDFS